MAISVQAAIRLQDMFTRPLMSIQAAVKGTTQDLNKFNSTAQAAGNSTSLNDMSNSITKMRNALQILEEKKRQISSWDTNGINQCNREINTLKESMGKAKQAQNEVNLALRTGNADILKKSYEKFNQEVMKTESLVNKNIVAQNNFNTTVSNSENVFGGILSKLKTVAGYYVGIQGIKMGVDFSKDSIEAANVQIEAETKLETIMRQRMNANDALINSVKQLASAQQEIGVVGDEVQMAGVQQLATFMNNAEALKTLMPAMNNLAVQQNGVNATSENMVSIGNMMGKVMQGQVSALTRVGVTFSAAEEKVLKYGNEQERATMLAKVITNNVGKMNEVIANTPQGAAQQLANTWGDMKEVVGMKLYPAVTKLIRTITENLPIASTAFSKIGDVASIVIYGISGIINMASKVGNIMSRVGNGVKENWGTIAPIIGGVAAAIGIYTAAIIANNVVLGISNGIKTLSAFASSVYTAALAMESGATFTATAAQYGFNTALLACPLTWIVIAIIAVITAIYAVVGAFNKMTGSSISATAIISGSIATVGALIYNMFLGLLDIVGGVIEYFFNSWIAFANFFANVFDDPIGSIIHLFGDLGDSVLGVIEKIASALDKVFGSNLAATVSGWRSGLEELTNYTAEKYGNGEYKEQFEKIDLDSITKELGVNLDRIDYSTAFNTGANFGEGIDESIKGISDQLKNLTSAANEGNAINKNGFGNMGKSDIGEVDKVKSVKGDIDISKEDLKSLRELATMEYMQKVNQNTIAPVLNVKIAEVKETADIDKVIDRLTIKVGEYLDIAAEGAY